MSADITLVFASATNHRGSQQVAGIVRDLIADNRSTGISVAPLDVDTEPERMADLGLTHVPALVLQVDGVERARLVGSHSKRAILQKILPEIHRNANTALIELRRQLVSPGEEFPRRVLKRREHITLAARVTMLENVALFADLTRKQREAVARLTDELVIDEGNEVTVEGQAGDQFFVLVSGKAKISRKGRKIDLLERGACFGEMSLLDGEPRSATVTTETRCILLALDRMAFQTMLFETPEVAIKMLELLSRRVRSTQRRASDDL